MKENLSRGIAYALNQEADRWSLSLEGEDPRSFLNDLVRGLKGTDSPTKRKKIPNKHRYVGLSPTIAWLLTCRDPSYPVMYDSLESFARLWDSCFSGLEDIPYHYVSLGVGTGDKDRHVIDRLEAANPDLLYLAVDISSHMLRLGTTETARRYPGRVLPIELDFERNSSLQALKRLAEMILGDEPIVFSLFGNSLANIDDDAAFLRDISALLRPQDRLILEVAVTERADSAAAEAAAAERTGSRLYNEFVTSALSMYTDLTIDTNWLRFDGSIEPGKGVRIEGRYVNCGADALTLTLPNRETVPFLPGEDIEVLLGRKYLRPGLNKALAEANLVELSSEYELDGEGLRSHSNSGENFGLGLAVYKRDPHAVRTSPGALSRVWQSDSSANGS